MPINAGHGNDPTGLHQECDVDNTPPSGLSHVDGILRRICPSLDEVKYHDPLLWHGWKWMKCEYYLWEDALVLKKIVKCEFHLFRLPSQLDWQAFIFKAWKQSSTEWTGMWWMLLRQYPLSCYSVDTVSWVNDVCVFCRDYVSVIQFCVCVTVKPTLQGEGSRGWGPSVICGTQETREALIIAEKEGSMAWVQMVRWLIAVWLSGPAANDAGYR